MGVWEKLISGLFFISVIGNNITSINGFISDFPNIYRVPKSSVSGHYLFLTYINALLRTIKYPKVQHFADDASLNFSGTIKLINKMDSLAYVVKG